MFQDAQGQWYDDSYNPIADPTAYNTPAQTPVQSAGGGGLTPGAGVPALTPDEQARWDAIQAGLNKPPTAPTQPGGGTPYGYTYGGTTTPPPAPPPTSDGGGGSAAANNAGFQWPGYQLPTPYQFTPFSYDSYSPLTADQAAQAPGYAFAAQQGRDAIQTSAAAKGNVLSGSTLKDLFSWGDQFAGQNYQTAENQNENVYNTNRNNAFNNWAGNQAGGLASWEANNQPAQFQFASGLQPQAALTFNDLLQRFQTGVNATTQIATAGAQ